jgi:hypothetical protein
MKTLIIAAGVCLITASTASADVHLTMQNGRVSIVAKDATVRQILTEWARVGQTKIVNVERVPGGPVSIELNNVPESQALEVLLRAMSGYIAAPRAVDVANLSRFDRIIVMPTLAGARAPVTSAPQPPTFQQPPQFNQAPPVADDEDEPPAPNVVMPQQNRGPVFNTFPQPQVVNPTTGSPMMIPGAQPANGAVPQQAVPTAQPTAVPAGGVSVPGMIVQPPQPPPGQPVAPGQPVRRPGGPFEYR